MLPLILLVASFLIFWAVHLLPGDPARIMAGMQADQQVVNDVRSRLGLDQPFSTQYEIFLLHALHGDLGVSIRSHKSVAQEIGERFPHTLALTTVSYIFALVMGLTGGVLAAVYRGRWLDHLVMMGAIAGGSIANFWLALMAMNLFAVELGWVPLIGADSWKSYILPAVTLGLLPGAVVARMCRASMLDIIHQDYIRTARAKGLSERDVVLRHALRNALNPVLTVIGLQFGSLLSGAIVTETIFSWPGIGRLTLSAISNRDYALVQGCILAVGLTYVLVNLLTDAAYAVADPRMRR